MMSLKTIKATVGQNAANIPTDVATIQYLLNCVPYSVGGPQRELKIDGFAGVITNEAVNRFQKAHFGSANSLVQTDGQTFTELKRYDPLPNSAMVIVPNTVFGKHGEKTAFSCGEKTPFNCGEKQSAFFKKSIDGGGVKQTIDGVKGIIGGSRKA
jgi:peptidoglycan hydrolase-like protein with peptidoglycan-binding domain